MRKTTVKTTVKQNTLIPELQTAPSARVRSAHPGVPPRQRVSNRQASSARARAHTPAPGDREAYILLDILGFSALYRKMR